MKLLALVIHHQHINGESTSEQDVANVTDNHLQSHRLLYQYKEG
jgi:hypothetical protein